MSKLTKKNLLIGGIAAFVLIIGAALMFYFYSVRPLELYGQKVNADITEYTLTEDVKADVDSLITALSQLKKLKKLDLGSYQVDLRDEDKLLKAFPGVDLTYSTCVRLYGESFPPDVEALDLSDKDLGDLSDLRSALPYLKNLKEVHSTGTVVPRETLDELRAAFPGVAFDLVSKVKVFGMELNDNVPSLDLTNTAVSFVSLKKDLALMTALEEVDLRGKEFTTAEKLELANLYPDVAFGWQVELAGKTYDSYIEELDLSGDKTVTPGLMKEMAPLFPKLKRLDMSDCGATNEEMASLRDALPDVKVVWRVYLGQKWSLKTDAVAFSVLIGDYSHRRMTSEDIEVLKYCTDLQALDLGHQAITDISVIGDYLTELRLLVLVDNQVSDLSPVAKLKHLHYIELFVNSRALTDISPLASCKELVDVNVSYLYNVTDFSPLFDLPLLERLWMEHTQVGGEQLAYIKEHYPNATIITQGTGSIDNGWRTHERYFAAWGKNGMFHVDCKELPEAFSKYDQVDS